MNNNIFMLDFHIRNRVDINHPQKYKNTGKKFQKEVKKERNHRFRQSRFMLAGEGSLLSL